MTKYGILHIPSGRFAYVELVTGSSLSESIRKYTADKVPDYNGCLAFYLEPSAAIPYPITLITASNKSLLNKLIKSYGFREDVCIDINKIDDYTLPEICEFEIVIME